MASYKKTSPNLHLRQARELRGWSQKYVAEQIDAPSTCYISRWELGRAAPSPFYREKLCALFGKDARELGFVQVDDKRSTNEHSTEENKDDQRACDSQMICTSDVFLLSASGSINPFAQTSSLIGRTEIFGLLKQRLCQDKGGGITALYGLPGVGKTSLTIELVYHSAVQQHFSDGVLWIHIGPQPDIPKLLSACATQLGLHAAELETLSGEESLVNAIRTAMGNRHMLLVLDDVWKSEEAFIFFQMGNINCSYLVTTRLPGVALHLTGSGALAVRELNEEDSLALLATFAPSVIVQEPTQVRKLVHLVGGLPLALTLMGKYLQRQAYGEQPRRLRTALERLNSAEERLRLSEERVFLEHRLNQPLHTHISLQALIETSVQQLEETSRKALYALALLPTRPHSFSEEAAIAVSATSSEILDILTDAGLLEGCGPGRYTLHQTIADFVKMKPVEKTARSRLVAYTLDYLKRHHADYQALDLEYPTILLGLKMLFELQQMDELSYVVHKR